MSLPFGLLVAGISGSSPSASLTYDIVLLIGQSNQSGRGIVDPVQDSVGTNTFPGVYQFDGYPSSGTYRTIIPGTDPLLQPDTPTAALGPGTWFAKTYFARTGRRVLLVPAAFGGTGLCVGVEATAVTWSPYGTNNGQYLSAISQANLAVTAAVSAFPGSALVGMLWVQGEADSTAQVTQSAYQQALFDLVTGMRTGITGAASTWFVMGRMVPEAVSDNYDAGNVPGNGTYPAIDAAHVLMGGALSKAAQVSVGTGFAIASTPRLHYAASGQRAMGPNMDAGTLVALANTGDATPVQVTGLASGTATATTMPLTWTAVTGARTYTVQYSSDGGTTWATVSSAITNVSSLTNSATAIGLSASTSYQFRVRANAYGAAPNGTFSSVVTTSTAAGLADAFVQLTTITGTHITQSGSAGAGWTYTAAVGTTFAADHAGTSSLKMPAGVNGALRSAISANAAANNWILALVTSLSDPAYSAGAAGYKFGLIAANTGNYKVIVDGGATTVTPNGNAAFAVTAGDIMQLSRSGSTIIAQVARSGAPTSFTTIHTFVATSAADLWGAISGNGNASAIGPLIGNGWA